MKRILFFHEVFPCGGAERVTIDIANYLSFSSQSHFIKTFENFMGITPKKYRDKYYKSMW